MQPGRNRRNRAALLDAGRTMGRAFSVRELHTAARAMSQASGSRPPTAPWSGGRTRVSSSSGNRAGEAMYLVCDAHGHHHHVVCVECGATSILKGCALSSALEASAAAGFELLDRELGALPARCGPCAGARGSDAPAS